jgi:LPXTG-motif cell wall-anchored protein
MYFTSDNWSTSGSDGNGRAINVLSLPTLTYTDQTLTLGADSSITFTYHDPSGATSVAADSLGFSSEPTPSIPFTLTVPSSGASLLAGITGQPKITFADGSNVDAQLLNGQINADIPVSELTDGATFALHIIPTVAGTTKYNVILGITDAQGDALVSAADNAVADGTATLTVQTVVNPSTPSAAPTSSAVSSTATQAAAAVPQTGDMASLYVIIAALLAIVIGSALLMMSRRKRQIKAYKRE